MSSQPPPIRGILETVLYYSDERRTEAFYAGVLGLRLVDRERGRSLFFRLGSSMLLLFDADRARSGGRLPPHGARGPIHVCFRVSADDYAAWKTHLERSGISLLSEVDWRRGRSFYFEDPDANLLEIANADIWPE